MKYEAVIGLEIHIQLATRTKMFCPCPVPPDDAVPNTYTCPVCLGMPGALPVPNEEAVNFALMLAEALNCRVNKRSLFARKNYFYPDLPKGYQITQDEIPIGEEGFLMVQTADGQKKIRIRRIHLEEDAGKSFHPMGFEEYTLVDFNRCGVPLIEIVSYPDMRSPEEAADYVRTMRQLVTYLGICHGDMEKGNLRVDANISVRPEGATELGRRTEIKNLNSFRFLQRALEYEIQRHIQILESGGEVVTETLLWNESEGRTYSMRNKEESSDYRYFPEPDLLPLVVTDEQIEKARSMVGELPAERMARFESAYGLPTDVVAQLCARKDFSDYADEVLSDVKDKRAAANWLLTELVRILNENNWRISQFPVSPKNLVELLKKLESGEISRPIAKDIFRRMVQTGKTAGELIEEMGVKVIADENALQSVVEQVLAENPDAVEKFRKGKTNIIGFIIGQVMKKTKGQADPKVVNQIVMRKLKTS